MPAAHPFSTWRRLKRGVVPALRRRLHLGGKCRGIPYGVGKGQQVVRPGLLRR